MNKTAIIVVTVIVTILALSLLGGIIKRSYIKGVTDSNGTETV